MVLLRTFTTCFLCIFAVLPGIAFADSNPWVEHFESLFVIGEDNDSQGEFGQESGVNAAPGSATVKDDDYYVVGSYSIGTVATDEPWANFERAVTSWDTRNRIHFNLNSAQASANARYRFTMDLRGAGGSGLIFTSHDLEVSINGMSIHTDLAIAKDKFVEVIFAAADFVPTIGENVIEIERTGGTASSWIQFDQVTAAVDPDGLADGDSDNLPRFWEEAFGLDDAVAGDAHVDVDGDGLTALQEYQACTNPLRADSDDDGLRDDAELAAGSDPNVEDSDGDTLLDGAEAARSPALSPILADSDADGGSDVWEIAMGSDPTSLASKAYSPAAVIGLHFVHTAQAEAILTPPEIAGLFLQPHWNHSQVLPNGESSNTLANLVNGAGVTTAATVTWVSRHAYAASNLGPARHRDLMAGYLQAVRRDSINNADDIDDPVSLTFSNIPYASYDVIVYVGGVDNNVVTWMQPQSNPAQLRWFKLSQSVPFVGFYSATEATQLAAIDTPDLTNYVRFENQSGATFMLDLGTYTSPNSGTWQSAGIHGVQIIDRQSNVDGDSLTDLEEMLAGLNPGVNDSSLDADNDGLTNAQELAVGTAPNDPDSDADGVLDGEEGSAGLDPLDPDSDDDNLADGAEMVSRPWTTDPTKKDTDMDTFDDDVELRAGSNPRDATSTPSLAMVPTYNATTRTLTWTLDQLQILWDHDGGPTVLSPWNEFIVLMARVQPVGIDGRLGMGLRYGGGRMTYYYYMDNPVFGRPVSGGLNSVYLSDWSFTTDLLGAFGFSLHGADDDSYPLRLTMSAHQPTAGVNVWNVTFSIHNVANVASPVLVHSTTQTGLETAPGFDPAMATWTGPWGGELGRPAIETPDGVVPYYSTTPLGLADADNDGMLDSWESTHGVSLPNEDPDSDGVTNVEEFLHGSDPNDDDSDNDGVKDGVELAHGSDPNDTASTPPHFLASYSVTEDLNGNGFPDAWEIWAGAVGLNPAADDDGDGLSNVAESQAGTDPQNGNDLLAGELTPLGNDLEIIWEDRSKDYVIQSNGDLGLDWDDVTGQQTTADGMRKQMVPDGMVGNRRFFRVTAADVDTDADGVSDWAENWLGSDPGIDPFGNTGSSSRQSMTTQSSQYLSGDFLNLLERLQGGTPSGGFPGGSGSTAISRANASRFLTQATFGPTVASIEELMALGYETWIDQQILKEPYLHQPYTEQIQRDFENGHLDKAYSFNEMSQFVNGHNVTTPFARGALQKEDQLRQRMAFALSQILVVSRSDAQLTNRGRAVAHYYDIFVRNAFGSYLDILLEVSNHAAMGWYLSHLGNQKADPSIPRYPDENYAREIMQLFTIGLWELNLDGTRKLDAAGEPIPTYGNAEITELARVFTGQAWDTQWFASGGWSEDHYTRPMKMFPEYHDFGRKELLNGFIVPSRNPSAENGMQDIQDAVTHLFEHPNTAPFTSKRLIQFFVTANPSPAYVQRVATVFIDNGSGVRGDLGAVIKAILLDVEARGPEYAAQDHFGKLREPVLRTMALARALGIGAEEKNLTWWNWEDSYFGHTFQEPTRSPSVFNFYTPQYQAPGSIRNEGYVSPVFQITDTFTSISMPNLIWSQLTDGLRSGNYYFPLNLSSLQGVADNPDGLLDRINLLLCQGQMSGETRRAILETISEPSLTSDEQILLAAYLAATCPDGAVQR